MEGLQAMENPKPTLYDLPLAFHSYFRGLPVIGARLVRQSGTIPASCSHMRNGFFL